MMHDSLALCWQNVTLYVTIKKKTFFRKEKVERLKLLHNVSGILRSGQLSAIMGPSGAGKTTLLAAISQRNTGILAGEIHINGRPVDKELMIKMCGFVPQQDLAIQTLTVKEHINFMASLKMDKRVSHVQKLRIINSLVQDLGLMSCSYTYLKNLSGGERKRVSLAVQLLTDPPILLCDEPTSGLDSSTASSVISLLRQLAGKGKAVICSVHQPSSGIFEMFDTVSLLVPGGKLAYFGDVSGANKYFEELNLICPPSFNTAEFLVKQLNTEPDKLCDKYLLSSNFIKTHKEIEAVKKATHNHQLIYGMDEKFLKFFSVQPPSKKTQLKWLIWRSALDVYRNASYIFFKIGIYLLTAFLVAIPYVGVLINQEGVQNIQGRNYAVITETIFTQAYAVMHTFPSEIPILLREVGSGVYHPAPYYFSKVVVLLPRVILESLLFATIVYLICGVGETSYFGFCFPVILCAIASSAYGFCISAMFENTRTASLLAVPFDFLSYTFSGLFLQISTAPVYLAWFKYVSRFYYGLEAMTILQWKNIDYIPCSPNPELPCIKDGKGVLQFYGYQTNNLAFDITSLLIFFLVMHAFGFYFLLRRSRKQSFY